MLASVKIVPETDRTTRPTQLESVISVSCVMDACYARLARAVLVDTYDGEVAGRFLLSSEKFYYGILPSRPIALRNL